jgi:hypothetical protein
MKSEYVLNKKVKLERSGKYYFFTITEILENTPDFILFYDNKHKQIYVRWKDIVEILE